MLRYIVVTPVSISATPQVGAAALTLTQAGACAQSGQDGLRASLTVAKPLRAASVSPTWTELRVTT